jgi:SAM-dependent methyltransferase
VPIVMTDPGAYLRAEAATVVERDLSPEVAAALVADGPDDAPYARMLEHISIYMDAHWGDRVEPAPDGPGAHFGLAPFVERIAALPRVELAVELGCSVGRIAAELPAEHVMAVDMHFGAVRRGRRLLAGEPVAYARRMIGRTYAPAIAKAGDRARTAKVVCGDVLEPPLVPGAFDRVVALNMLDSVSRPRRLLSVIDGLTKVGGEVILASPYAWQSSVMHDEERIGGTDPATAVADLLRTGLSVPYRVEDEAELSWTLRRDARSAITYQTHYLRARKGT